MSDPPTLPTRRPMVSVAALVIGGVLLHALLPHGPGALLVAAAVGLGGGLLLVRRVWASRALIAVGLLAAGAGLGQAHSSAFAADDVALVAAERPRLARVRYEVATPPGLVPPDEAAGLPLPPKQAWLAEARAVLTPDGWRQASGSLLVQALEPAAGVRPGQVRETLGMLQRPGPAMNPGQFDWRDTYRARRVAASLRVRSPGAVVEAAGPPSPLAAARAWVRGRLDAGFGADQRTERALLAALLLGEHDPEMSDVRDDFRALGASHHLAISGMHVAVLGGLALGLLRLARVPPRAALLAAAGFVVVFALLVVPSPGVWRAAALTVAAAAGLTLRRQADPLQLLAAAAALLVVLNPAEVYAAGFQLSFGTVLGLILLTPPLKARLIEAARPPTVGDGGEGGGGPASGAVRAARWADSKLLGGLAAALVAWLVSLPLIALHFETLNPWAVAAGLLLTGPTVLALVAALAKVLLTAAVPGLADVWAGAAGWAARVMSGSADALTVLPGAQVPLPAPPVWLVVAYYAALLLLLVPWPTAGVRWLARLPLPACLVLILALPFAGPVPLLAAGQAAATSGVEVGGCRVTVLAVGAGQCVVVEPPGGRVVLVDAGSGSMSDPLRTTIGPFLRHRGRTSADTLVLTHANLDHYAAAADVVDRYGVREVLAAPAFAADARREGAGRALLARLDAADRPPRAVAAGATLRLAQDTTLTVLWPAGDDDEATGNDGSLVLRLDHAGRSVLLPADVQDDAMAALLAAGADLRCDVLLAPHHGSAEPSTAAFVAAADPLWVVSSNDRTLSQKQVRFAGAVQNRPLLRTHEVGAVTIHLRADGTVGLETHRGGWFKR